MIKKLTALLMILLMLAPAVIGCAQTEAPAKETATSEKPQTSEPTKTESGALPTESEEQTVTPSQPADTEEPSTETPAEPSTETPVDTPTPEPDGKGKTEEQLGVLPVGQYVISSASDGKILSYAEGKYGDDVNIPATIDGEQNTVTIAFQTYKNNPYYLIYAGEDSMHVLGSPYNSSWSDREIIRDGEEVVFRGKKYMSGGNAHYDDKWEPLQWRLIKQEDGTYAIRSNKEGMDLYLAFSHGKVIAASPDKLGEIPTYNLTMTARGGGNAFRQWISDEGNVAIRMAYNIKKYSKLTEDELQAWANELDDAYLSYCELTDFVTYDNLIVKAFEPAYVPGYVWNTTEHYNVITLNESFMRSDLQKKKVRAKQYEADDWNFCALHEMGHMFDNQQPWYFEAEMMTDLKVAYVLQKNGACAAPSEYAAKDFFYADRLEGHQQIEDCYLGLAPGQTGADRSLEYSPFNAALKFVQIQRIVDDDNWTVYKQVYKELHAEGRPDYWNSSIAFRLFVNKIAEVSGQDVRALFTGPEWNVYLTKVNDNFAVYFYGSERKLTSTGSVAEGESKRLSSDFDLRCNESATLIYESSNPSVATVDENGVITGVARGKAVITIRQSVDGGEATLNLTVTG